MSGDLAAARPKRQYTRRKEKTRFSKYTGLVLDQCPWCESKNTEVLDIINGEENPVELMVCADCKREFEQVYRLYAVKWGE